jgi:hypothetical protein
MTVVDQTTDRPIPVVPRSRRLARALAKPGWVIMTLLSLLTIAFVARYLAFNPDTYFPEQREVYMRREWVLGVHVVCGILALAIGPLQFVGRIRRRFVRCIEPSVLSMSQAAPASDCPAWCLLRRRTRTG